MRNISFLDWDKLNILHNWLHIKADEAEKISPEFFDMHAVIAELMNTGTNTGHPNRHSELDKALAKIPSPLQESVDSLSNIIIENEPSIFIVGSSLVHSENQDTDIIFLEKKGMPAELELEIKSKIPNNDILEYEILELDGHYLPLYRRAWVKCNDNIQFTDKKMEFFKFFPSLPVKRDTNIVFPAIQQPLLSGLKFQIHRVYSRVVILDYQGNIAEENSLTQKIREATLKHPCPIFVINCIFSKNQLYISDYFIHDFGFLYNTPYCVRKPYIDKFENEDFKAIPSKIINTPSDLIKKEALQVSIIQPYKETGEYLVLYEKQSVRPGIFFTPLKVGADDHKEEWFDFDSVWNYWAKGFIEAGRKIQIETKENGIRCELHRDKDRIWLFTEGEANDRSEYLGQIVKAIKELPSDTLILDTELVWWEEGKPKDRGQMAAIWGGKTDLSDQDIRVNIFDIVYLNGEDLHLKLQEERTNTLDKIAKDFEPPLYRMSYTVCSSKEEMQKAFDRYKEFPGSEGVLLKLLGEGSEYQLKGSTDTWCDCCETLNESPSRALQPKDSSPCQEQKEPLESIEASKIYALLKENLMDIAVVEKIWKENRLSWITIPLEEIRKELAKIEPTEETKALGLINKLISSDLPDGLDNDWLETVVIRRNACVQFLKEPYNIEYLFEDGEE